MYTIEEKAKAFDLLVDLLEKSKTYVSHRDRYVQRPLPRLPVDDLNTSTVEVERVTTYRREVWTQEIKGKEKSLATMIIEQSRKPPSLN